MKKIVALVLAMVMVLGLATTAFGATYNQYTDKDVTLTDSKGAVTVLEDAFVVKYEKDSSTLTENGKTTTTITPAYYLVDGELYVVVDKSQAAFSMKVEDVVAAVYVATMTDVPTINAADVATAYTAPKKAECGKVGAGFASYYVVDGKYYAANVNGTKTALLNGNLVVMDAVPTLAKGHNFAEATAVSFDSKTSDITSVKCPDCDAVVTVYKNAGSFDGKIYVLITEGPAAGYYFVAGAAANAGAAADGETVTSPKTFDAGIAMYVGMSVMAAAGSAVVLKKKD